MALLKNNSESKENIKRIDVEKKKKIEGEVVQGGVKEKEKERKGNTRFHSETDSYLYHYVGQPCLIALELFLEGRLCVDMSC